MNYLIPYYCAFFGRDFHKLLKTWSSTNEIKQVLQSQSSNTTNLDKLVDYLGLKNIFGTERILRISSYFEDYIKNQRGERYWWIINQSYVINAKDVKEKKDIYLTGVLKGDNFSVLVFC